MNFLVFRKAQDFLFFDEIQSYQKNNLPFLNWHIFEFFKLLTDESLQNL